MTKENVVETCENKKTSIVRMLQIFLKYSDYNHRLTQADIARLLSDDYGLTLERRAISRNISMLKNMGFELESFQNGTYLAERPLEDSELRILIDGILSSKNISEQYSHDLINKLIGLGNIYFKDSIKNIHAVDKLSKTNNKNVFLNIDIIDEAIRKEVQINFDYNKYGIDKQLYPSTNIKASPYQFIFKNQCYYLICYNEKWKNIAYYRVDHITNIKLLPKTPITQLRMIPGYEKGIDYKQIGANPYMFNDEMDNIEFVADSSIINQIVEWFGQDVDIKEKDDKFVTVNVQSSIKAMEYWAMQYMNYVEILKPQSLREKIIHNIKLAKKKYTD